MSSKQDNSLIPASSIFVSLGNLLNIKDAYSSPMFYRGIDDSTGFRTRYVVKTIPLKSEPALTCIDLSI